jgi:hypothetical protein
MTDMSGLALFVGLLLGALLGLFALLKYVGPIIREGLRRHKVGVCVVVAGAVLCVSPFAPVAAPMVIVAWTMMAIAAWRRRLISKGRALPWSVSRRVSRSAAEVPVPMTLLSEYRRLNLKMLGWSATSEDSIAAFWIRTGMWADLHEASHVRGSDRPGGRARPGIATRNGKAVAVPVFGIPDIVPTGLVYCANLLTGATFESYAKTAEAMAQYLHVPRVIVEQSPEQRAGGLVAFRIPLVDPLRETTYIRDFLVVHGSTDLSAVAIAKTENGQSFPWGYSHTLCVGASGSGKASVFFSLLAGLRDWWEKGEVLFYGIDPKRAEFNGLEGGFFAKTALEFDAIADLLEELVQKLEQRQLHFGRNYRSDRDHPLVLIFVDELLVLMHDRDAQRRKRNADALTRILVLGRSHGFYVVAATQAPQKAALDLV